MGVSEFRKKREIEPGKPTRFYSKRQEESIAKAINGKRQPNSGATTFMPGDVVNDKWLFEAKTCTKKQDSFSIKKKWIEKNLDESLLANKEYCAVVFNFGPDEPNYYIIDEQTFKILTDNL